MSNGGKSGPDLGDPCIKAQRLPFSRTRGHERRAPSQLITERGRIKASATTPRPQQQSRPLLRCRTIKSGELFGLAASATSPGGLPEKVTRWLTPHLTKGRTCQNSEQRLSTPGRWP